MTNFKVARNADKTFNVVDVRFNKEIKFNLSGKKAAAYVEYCEQELTKAEKFWEAA